MEAALLQDGFTKIEIHVEVINHLRLTKPCPTNPNAKKPAPWSGTLDCEGTQLTEIPRNGMLQADFAEYVLCLQTI